MSDVCIKCAGKHKDFRSESGHLTYDPQYGTVLEPHYVEPQSDKDLAILYRKAGNVARKQAFMALRSLAVLDPTNPKGTRYGHTWPTMGAPIFTLTWKPEARDAFFRTRVAA